MSVLDPHKVGVARTDEPASSRVADELAALREELRALREAVAVPGRWLSVCQAATYAGLSSDSIRDLISTGKLTGRRPVRGRILIDRGELDRLIEGSTKQLRSGRGRYERGPQA